jgi:hypothetical protein
MKFLRFIIDAFLTYIILGIMDAYQLFDKYPDLKGHPMLARFVVAFISLFVIDFAISTFLFFKRSDNTVTITKVNIANKSFKANENVLLKNLFSTSPMRPSIFKIHTQFTIGVDNNDNDMIKLFTLKKLDTVVDIDRSTTKEKASLIGGVMDYSADIIVFPRELLNFEFEKDVFVKSLSIEEKYMP